eukprot:9481045-Lingulodinium_polyedra.AAC.1
MDAGAAVLRPAGLSQVRRLHGQGARDLRGAGHPRGAGEPEPLPALRPPAGPAGPAATGRQL